jgi:FkbM family methyltransferase
MAFENLRGVLRVSANPLSAVKLILAVAVTSRPKSKTVLLPVLRLFANVENMLWVKAACTPSGKTTHYAIRLSEISSDLLSFYEVCLRNCYRIVPKDAPDAIIDGGANIGLFTLAAKNLWPNGEVFSVEPLEANLRLIENHLQKNKYGATLLSACLGPTKGSVVFYVREANRGGLNSSDPFRSKVDVPVLRLSDIYAPLRGKRVLVKLDIEGAEMEVVPEFLAQCPTRCKLIGELHHWKHNEDRFQSFLKAAGWNVSFFSRDDVCVLFSAQSPDWD